MYKIEKLKKLQKELKKIGYILTISEIKILKAEKNIMKGKTIKGKYNVINKR